MAFLLGPVEAFVEGAAEAVEQVVGFVWRDDQRRAEANGVAANGAADQAFVLRERYDFRRRRRVCCRRIAWIFLSLTSSRPPIRPTPRASPTRGWSASFVQPPLECGRDLADVTDDVDALVDLDGLAGDR